MKKKNSLAVSFFGKQFSDVVPIDRTTTLLSLKQYNNKKKNISEIWD